MQTGRLSAHAFVAQLAERHLGMMEVKGSITFGSSGGKTAGNCFMSDETRSYLHHADMVKLVDTHGLLTMIGERNGVRLSEAN